MNSHDKNCYVLITGASKGLGRSFAQELAGKGKNLLLVSLPGEGLEQLSEELANRFTITVHYFECDLSKKKSVYLIAEWANQFENDTLINNAGIGGSGKFDIVDPKLLSRMIGINVYSTAMLTRLLLPNLLRQQKSFVLNVSSMAAFGPIAYKTVYPASKAFILSFSRGLNEEFRKTNLFVSVLHPGPMRTNADVVQRIEKLGIFGGIGLLSTERMAYIAVRQLYRRNSVIIPGFFNKVNWLLFQIVPVWIRLPIVSWIFRKEFR
jgi:uncharacterized protein